MHNQLSFNLEVSLGEILLIIFLRMWRGSQQMTVMMMTLMRNCYVKAETSK